MVFIKSNIDLKNVINKNSGLLLVAILKEYAGSSELITPILNKISIRFSSSIQVIQIDEKLSKTIFPDLIKTEFPILLFIKAKKLINVVEGVYPLQYYEKILLKLLSK